MLEMVNFKSATKIALKGEHTLIRAERVERVERNEF
jgi:hypothetical protein